MYRRRAEIIYVSRDIILSEFMVGIIQAGKIKEL
jgi:hypothetical protein